MVCVYHRGVLYKSLPFVILSDNCVELENVIKTSNCKKKNPAEGMSVYCFFFCVVYLTVSATIWTPVYGSPIECVCLIVCELEISTQYSSLAVASQETITVLLISRFSHQA